MNRARSEQKRDENLKEYLRRNGYTPEQYALLEQQARRPFYTQEDGTIIISSHQFYGCLIQSADTLSASQRPCDPGNLRHIMRVSDLVTNRRKPDGIYTRLVMPKSGTGQPLSNQRTMRSNAYIEQFTARGQIGFYPDDVHNVDELQDFLIYAGERIGVGASRKMGCGRFEVTEYKLL